MKLGDIVYYREKIYDVAEPCVLLELPHEVQCSVRMHVVRFDVVKICFPDGRFLTVRARRILSAEQYSEVVKECLEDIAKDIIRLHELQAKWKVSAPK